MFQHPLQIEVAFEATGLWRLAEIAPVAVRVWRVVYRGQERRVGSTVPDTGGGKAYRPHRSSVEGTCEGNDPLPPRVEPGKLYSLFNGLSPSVAEEEHVEPLGGDPSQSLTYFDEGLIVEDTARVDKGLYLSLYSLDHLRMVVACVDYCKARGEVHIPPALHILHIHTPRPLHHQRGMDHKG